MKRKLTCTNYFIKLKKKVTKDPNTYVQARPDFTFSGVGYHEFRPLVMEEQPFKDISYLELWQPFWIDICAILEEGAMRNNSVKLF